VTLLVFVLQFRSGEKAIREASYQGLMGRYNDFIRTLADRPEYSRLLMDYTGIESTPEEALVYGHLLVAYGIIEEAFLLYKRGWIDEDNWSQWSAWLKLLCDRPQIRMIQKRSRGTFDKRFEEYVDNLIKAAEAAPVSEKE
jgi:hypothetical protein